MAELGLTSLQGASEAWSFALGAFAIVVSCLSGLVVARYRFRIQLYKAQTERMTRMRELDIAERKMLAEAQLERDKALAEPTQPEIPFPFTLKPERPAIAAPETEAA